MVNMPEKIATPAELCIIYRVEQVMNEFLKLFQKEVSLILLLYSEMTGFQKVL